MQISIDTNVDSEKDIAAVADMLRTFLFCRTRERLPDASPPRIEDPVTVFNGDGTAQMVPAAQIPPPPPPGWIAEQLQELHAAVTDAPVSAEPTEPVSAERELDGAGLPWDARIHSETRKRNADGSWRLRRNLDEAIKSAVVSELRATYPQAAPAAPVVVPPPPPPAQVMVPPPPAAGALPPGPPVGVQPGAAQIAVTDFKSLMAKAGALMQAGKLTHPLLAQACVACGVASLPALMSQPDKIPAVDAWLTANVPQ